MFAVKQQRHRGHRVLPARPGRPAHRGRGREHRPWPDPQPDRGGPDRASTSPPASRGWSARASAPTSPSPTPTRTSRSSADIAELVATGPPSTASTCATSPPSSPRRPGSSPTSTSPATTTRPGRSTRSARIHWERIEPVAESFGDLDPRLDLREADLADGEAWTGWHRIEKDLWPPAEGYTPLTREERARSPTSWWRTPRSSDRPRPGPHVHRDQLGNGREELLDEVATGKVTGEEEAWSHTDLWDFQANVDGARVAFEVLAPA